MHNYISMPEIQYFYLSYLISFCAKKIKCSQSMVQGVFVFFHSAHSNTSATGRDTFH